MYCRVLSVFHFHSVYFSGTKVFCETFKIMKFCAIVLCTCTGTWTSCTCTCTWTSCTGTGTCTCTSCTCICTCTWWHSTCYKTGLLFVLTLQDRYRTISSSVWRTRLPIYRRQLWGSTPCVVSILAQCQQVRPSRCGAITPTCRRPDTSSYNYLSWPSCASVI